MEDKYSDNGMTRSELIKLLASKFPTLKEKDATEAVNLILEEIVKTLALGNRVEIRGFGSFVVSQRSPRVGRNPKTGAKVLVPSKNAPHFRAGKELRERVIDKKN